MIIPISEPFINGKEFYEIKQALKLNQISSYGAIISKFEKKISIITNSKYVVSCSSGTAALHIALKVVGVKNDDEVIVPTITFIATINSVNYLKANPVFMDCDEYFNIDPLKTAEFIEKQTYLKNGFTYNKKTKRRVSAIIPVHVWGNASNINKLSKLCKKRNIKIVEDCTEALGTYYKNKKKSSVGSIGDIGCFSFNGNKIITTGNGGVLIMKKKIYADYARYLISQATDNGENFLHDEIGYNYRFSSLNAAFGIGQLKKFKFYLKKKKEIHKMYLNHFKDSKTFSILKNPNYSYNNNWLNILLFKPIYKNKIIKKFKEKNFQVKNVWKPNHLQKPYRKNEVYKLNNYYKFYNGSICLPSSVNLTPQRIKKICKTILSCEK